MTSQPVFQLRIQLEEVVPTVWRRLLVPGGVRLAKLHDMFQAAMGWTNSHLHSFTIGDQLYGMHVEDWPEEELDEKDFTVFVALRGGVRRFKYEYDFGDSWGHEVVVEGVSWSPVALKFGVCLDGQNACPPEDVGGTGGYADFLEALADPLHEEHDNYLVWVGYKFDPEAFELGAANAALQHVR
ncbi:MAG: plasmid pRiA4b ORF-3 family protein [Acidimicrobiales bacterium]